MSTMTYFANKLRDLIVLNELTPYKVAIEAKMDSTLLYKILDGERMPSDGVLKKLASVKELGISFSQLRAWKMLAEYTLDEVKEAISIIKKGGKE